MLRRAACGVLAARRGRSFPVSPVALGCSSAARRSLQSAPGDTKDDGIARYEHSEWLDRDYAIDYTDAGELGSGAYAVVRRGKHRESGVDVAVKSMRGLSGCIESAVRELEVGDQLHGIPGVVTYHAVYGIPENGEECIHFVAPLLEGGDLFDYVIDRGNVPEQTAAEMCYSIYKALSECHMRGWMHLDLKLENIGLQSADVGDSDGPVVEPMLLDFGHARALPESYSVLQTDGDIGSESYASPEVLQRSQYSASSDTWSFGILTYAMLVGSLPWRDGEQEDFLNSNEVVQSQLQLLNDRANLRTETISFLSDILVIEPEQRPRLAELAEHPFWSLVEGTTDDSSVGTAAFVAENMPAGAPLPDHKRMHQATKSVLSKMRLSRLRSVAMASLSPLKPP